MKISAYPSMNLRGEVRESISLDEDDLSDVEDEVFIRDGKNGYKLADELTVKRPLMAPRRKTARSEIGTRHKAKPPYRAFFKPCCYIFIALSILIGLIILVVVLVSMYPLPLDKVRDWIIKRSQKPNEFEAKRLLPCDNLKVTDVWSISLPKLTTDSAVRVLDVNNDGVDDILFGFGTGDNYKVLPPDIFCPIFMGVPPPCEGGIIALNGLTGDIIWRHWFNDTIFSLHCNVDINGDQQNDCLVVGAEGTIAVINTKNGTLIWKLNTGQLNVNVVSFIPDKNNDSIPDIIAAHSSLGVDRDGSLTLFSGKTGEELRKIKTPNGAKTFYMPQIINQNNGSYVIFGTGSPATGGNLTVTPLDDIVAGVLSNRTKNVYEDKYKGVLTQSVLVDITGDAIPDIITAMYNSTVVAFNGKTFEQIWNFTIPGAETNIVPTPAYFNFDNITDFLIIYQKYDNILNYNYTQTYIIDGKNGKSIYKPITGGIITQTGGLSVSLESFGYDMYLFWTSECTNLATLRKFNGPKGEASETKEFFVECLDHSNNTVSMKLNALSQFHEPPGFVLYNSAERISQEFEVNTSVLKQVKEHYKTHPKIRISSLGQSEVDENYKVDSAPIGIRKYGSSSFRHRDRNPPLQGYMSSSNDDETFGEERNSPIMDQDYDANYYPSMEDTIPYGTKHASFNHNIIGSNSRDPRSKEKKTTNFKMEMSSSKKKNLSEKNNGIYDYANVRRSRNRLLHDVDYAPAEILKDTYVKNEELRLKKSRFQQRDVNEHIDKIKEKEEIQKIIKKQIEEAKKNASLSLWDLESEKEMKDFLEGQYRGKREANVTVNGFVKVTSVGAIMESFNTTNKTSTIDIVFITYWQPPSKKMQDILKQANQECIRDKFDQDKTSHDRQKTTDKERTSLFERECTEEQVNLKNEFDFFDQLSQLRFGQLTVYRLRIECECVEKKKGDHCAEFLQENRQRWPAYLGRAGDGNYATK